MRASLAYQLLADAVLTLHFAVVAFVVGGALLVLLGNGRGWRWVNAFRFRLLHLAAIAFIVAEAWLGAACPLTTVEMWLRQQGQGATYRRSFIEHWVQRLLYIDAPPWVFVLGYTLFGLGVVALWLRFPPEPGRHGGQRPAQRG